ncbi:uncharacterized protein LOC120071887 [Benincasa hispida]|uniref:uncharacterized protein LOC120071887 n=1 Tax=Benincasa hispida TaxID=102211 RepID=UPI0019024FB0|nr:uncharacterized protein LOC120071887 [Benincasa hispida]XP_038880235.1 uncharacterized protein LOC120071887 [Benincasa hispida]XP_038880243.1 uncharacterized protein LOC120071887 [Benincasa hispida]XP_038880250.1 uncharacterized protein LOC120071887 [Benincasa hispida]XP_038880259.1 uncharacterized protein LOC120071887 [Benincasa hispida]
MEKRFVHKQTKTADDMDAEQTKLDGLTSLSQVHSSRRKRKRNDIETIDGIRKMQSKGVKTVEKEVELVDEISGLPESVIHHILSFLRSAKEAARTSILSKKWRDAWKSFSVLTFDERFFLKTEVDLSRDNRRQTFIDSIDNSLRSHLAQNLGICKLVLRITPKLVPYLKQWVEMAGANGLGELDIHVEITHQRYKVPPFMHSIKTLTGLRLHGLNWSSFEASEFKNLQKLYLRRLQVDQQIIQQLVSTSPLLMDLRIIECLGLKNLEISGFQKLERVDLYQCHGLKTIEFQVTSLKTFWYCTKKYSWCKLNLESCTSLKRLAIEDPSMTDTFFNKLLVSFPILEKLDLSRCNKFKIIEISNAKLRSLGLRSCKRLKAVDIDTLTPCSLDYTGHHMVYVLGRLHLNKAKFSLVSKKEDGEYNFPIRNIGIQSFLRCHCNGFKIIVWFCKTVIIYDGSKEIFLPPSPNLKLDVIKPSTDVKDLLDDLLTKGHPERIMVVPSPSSEVLKVLHRIEREADPSCCSYINSNRKCWRHFLEDAKIMNNAGVEDISGWFNFLDQVTIMNLRWEPPMHFGKVSHHKKDSDQGL